MKRILVLFLMILFSITTLAKDPSEKLDARVTVLEEVTALQQEQIDGNAEDIAEIQPQTVGKWVVLDSDDPPKPVGILIDPWPVATKVIISLEGHPIVLTLSKNKISSNVTLFFEESNCAGDIYAQSVGDSDFNVFPATYVLSGLVSGSMLPYLADGPRDMGYKEIYSLLYSNGYCEDLDWGPWNLSELVRLRRFGEYDLYEMYPPPYSLVKQ